MWVNKITAKKIQFHATLDFTPNTNIDNRCKIYHAQGLLFWVTEKYIDYLTNLKERFGKISRIF